MHGSEKRAGDVLVRDGSLPEAIAMHVIVSADGVARPADARAILFDTRRPAAYEPP